MAHSILFLYLTPHSKRLYSYIEILGSNRTHVYGWHLLKALRLSMKE